MYLANEDSYEVTCHSSLQQSYSLAQPRLQSSKFLLLIPSSLSQIRPGSFETHQVLVKATIFLESASKVPAGLFRLPAKLPVITGQAPSYTARFSSSAKISCMTQVIAV